MAQPDVPDPAAAGMSLRYEWNAASMPPPYHYEYVITIGPGPDGEVTFFPDYPQHGIPAWREPFSPGPAALKALLALMERQGVFTRRWRRPVRRTVGDSMDWLKVEAGGRSVAVPAELTREGEEAIAPVYEAIRSLVPRALWDDLMERYDQYQKQHPED